MSGLRFYLEGFLDGFWLRYWDPSLILKASLLLLAPQVWYSIFFLIIIIYDVFLWQRKKKKKKIDENDEWMLK